MLMKNILKKTAFIFAVLMFAGAQILPAKAEEPDYSNTDYWNSMCTNNSEMTVEQQASCSAYLQYMKEQNEELQKQIDEIDSKKSEISDNIVVYASKANEYNKQIQGLNAMMQDLNMQIDGAQIQADEIALTIADSEEKIEFEKAQIASLKERVSNRIAQSQGSMRLNQYLDVIMGAETFSDFVRVVSGLSDIYQYDSNILEEMNESVKTLNEMQEKLLEDQAQLKQVQMDLETGKSLLTAQQAALLASKYEMEVVQKTYEEKLSTADNDLKEALAAVTQNEGTIDNIAAGIEESEKVNPSPTPEPEQSGTNPSATADAQSGGNENQDSGNSSWSTGGNGNPAQGSGSNPYYTPYEWGNCTWSVWQLVYNSLGIALPGWHYPVSWISEAQAAGYATGSEPAPNSIAVYVGHVAFCTEVGDGQIYIKEGNYMGSYMERWVPLDALPYTGQQCLGFIYLQ